MDVIGTADPYFRATIDDERMKYTYVAFNILFDFD
jgi:hypothetical protein